MSPALGGRVLSAVNTRVTSANRGSVKDVKCHLFPAPHGAPLIPEHRKLGVNHVRTEEAALEG